MAYCLEQFGPALKFPWSRLVAPELTNTIREKLLDSSKASARGRNFSELSKERDAGLIAIAQAWKKLGKLV